jgi:hypothetical protein
MEVRYRPYKIESRIITACDIKFMRRTAVYTKRGQKK